MPLFSMPANPAVKPWDIYSSIQIIFDLWKASILPTGFEVKDIRFLVNLFQHSNKCLSLDFVGVVAIACSLSKVLFRLLQQL